MACLELDSSQFLSDGNVIDSPFDIRLECNSLTGSITVSDHNRYAPSQCTNAPDPPPLPGTSYGTQRTSRNAKACRCVPEESQDFWDKLFFEAYQYDLRVLTADGNEIMSHSCVVGIKSYVLRAMLEEAKVQDGIRHILIPGVPSEAVHVFIRFLYSSRTISEECLHQPTGEIFAFS